MVHPSLARVAAASRLRVFGCFVVLLGSLLGCAAHPQAVHDAPIASLHWLAGQWARTDLPAGDAGTEQWAQAVDGWTGTGSTYRQGVLRFREQLRIVREGDAVFYIADVPDNPAPVKFRLTEQTDQSVVFENPAHDFPQRITYHRDGDVLVARVSGAGQAQEFRFQRVPPVVE